jgi:hypothetical protein
MVHGFAAGAGRLDCDRQLLFDFLLPMTSARLCGRNFNSNDESSSSGAADTMRSRVNLGLSPGVGTLWRY